MKPYLTCADICRAYGLNKDIFSLIKPKLRRLRIQGNRVRYCPDSRFGKCWGRHEPDARGLLLPLPDSDYVGRG